MVEKKKTGGLAGVTAGKTALCTVGKEGAGLTYCGYIGGLGHDEGAAIAVDAAGNAYVTGNTTSDGQSFAFEIDPFRKHCLLEGLDDIGLTLQHVDEIKAYEARRRQEAPWLF